MANDAINNGAPQDHVGMCVGCSCCQLRVADAPIAIEYVLEIGRASIHMLHVKDA